MRRGESPASDGPRVGAAGAARVWPACVRVEGLAAGWRWGDGGDDDRPRRDTFDLGLRVAPREAEFRLQATSTEAPVDGRVLVEVTGPPAELARLLAALRRESRVVMLPEDRGLVSLRLGGTALSFDLLDGVVRLTPTGDP